jgi:hypothetical protein
MVAFCTSVQNFNLPGAIVSRKPDQSQTAPEQGRTVQIPEIAVSLKTLFILRTVVALALVFAGIECLDFGRQMLVASLTASAAQSILFEISGNLKVTAGGFGAVVMAASLVPFYLAYLSRPTIEVKPISGGRFEISDSFKRTSFISRLLKRFGRESLSQTNNPKGLSAPRRTLDITKIIASGSSV